MNRKFCNKRKWVYYISNHYSWTGYFDDIKENVEVYVKDGHETVIYENMLICGLPLCILFHCSGIIVGIYF